MDFPGYKVLIVDDEEMIRKLLVSLLSKQGVSCEVASDGLEAMNKIETETFDAVITDIEMPGMDGITLTKAISSRYPNLPIMVMSGFTRKYSIGSAIAAGARDFIKKPFTVKQFLLSFKTMQNSQTTLSKIMTRRAMARGDSNSLEERILRLRWQLAPTGGSLLDAQEMA